MGWFEIALTAVALSMDAFAVAVCKGLAMRRITLAKALIVGLWFGIFQALMPLIGYFAGISFADLVSSVDHWIAFVLLGFIGWGMIKESREPDEHLDPDFSFRTMLAMAVATSIDALAVGVSLAFLKVDIFSAVLLIGVTTAVFSMVGVRIGNVFGSRCRSAAELLGGLILIIMGIKILVEHTLL